MIFRDLFVLQLVGMLSDSKFDGTLHLAGECIAEIDLRDGAVCGVRCENQAPEDALQKLLWQHAGQFELDATHTPSGEIAYTELVESIIQHHAPPMPATCPMMLNFFIKRTTLKPVQQSAFRDTGFNILLSIKKGDIVPGAQQLMPTEEFWPALLHLASNGQIICTYAPLLGKLLHDMQQSLNIKFSKLLGPHIAKTYEEKLSAYMLEKWPEWQPDGCLDPLYGAAPYYDWAHSLYATIQEIGAPTITSRSYKKAVAELAPEQVALWQQLLS